MSEWPYEVETHRKRRETKRVERDGAERATGEEAEKVDEVERGDLLEGMPNELEGESHANLYFRSASEEAERLARRLETKENR